MTDECRHIYVRRDESGRRFCDDCGNEIARADPPPPDVQAHIKWISLKLDSYDTWLRAAFSRLSTTRDADLRASIREFLKSEVLKP